MRTMLAMAIFLDNEIMYEHWTCSPLLHVAADTIQVGAEQQIMGSQHEVVQVVCTVL